MRSCQHSNLRGKAFSFLVASADFSGFTQLDQLGHMPISDPNSGVMGICSCPGLPSEVLWCQLARALLFLRRSSLVPGLGLGVQGFQPLCRYHRPRCSQWSWICGLPGQGHGSQMQWAWGLLHSQLMSQECRTEVPQRTLRVLWPEGRLHSFS